MERVQGKTGADPFGKHSFLARDSVYKMNEALKNLQSNNVYKPIKKEPKVKERNNNERIESLKDDVQKENTPIRELPDEEEVSNEKEELIERLLNFHTELGQYVEALHLGGK